jgi:RNA polymerase sigma-70 factor (ECF subfamily)
MDDAEAVRQCRTGHMEAFQHLVRRYQGRALAHGRALTGNDADAADAAQDAFIDAFRNLHHFDVQREFYPWFYVLLRNRCFKQRTRPGTRPESGPLSERQAAAGPSAEQAIDLHAALARLDRADRELVVLKHLDGWTYEELAVRLEIPPGTVMSRLFNARRRLLALLGGERS